ncbi:MAG: flagellar hook-associated protein FlgL [Myxococcales bacterium]|nr:flagellar hook-associated protein FlgL [Myxococcales bacterium]
MRVTDSQVFARLSGRVAAAWERLARLQDQAATGRRVNRPSDDPAAAARIGALDEFLARLRDCQDGAHQAQAWLEGAESALASASDTLIRARELAVQGASEQYSPADRAALAAEAQELYQQLLASSNAQVAGRYLFAGFQEDAPAFDSTGTYQGDDGELWLEVSPGLRVAANLPGDRVFSGAGGGVDLFATLDGLRAALAADDSVAIRASLSGLEQGLEQLNAARAELGTRYNTVSFAQEGNSALRVSSESDRGRLGDADWAQLTSELATAERALQAALATFPMLQSMSLLARR